MKTRSGPKTEAASRSSRSRKATAERARASYSVWWANLCGLVEQLQHQAHAILSEIGPGGDHPLRGVVDDVALSDVHVALIGLSEELPKAAPKPAGLPDPLAGVPAD